MDFNTPLWRHIGRHINVITGEDQSIHRLNSVNGGDISQSFSLLVGPENYFVKLNTTEFNGMFDAEAFSLTTLKKMIRAVPHYICHGECQNTSYLVLAYIKIGTSGDEALLGKLIAELHNQHSPRFGWEQNNYIGATPQNNQWQTSWADFWWQNRLQPQLTLAEQNGHQSLRNYTQALEQAIKALLSKHHPTPSLLHGDLWSGNKGYLENGQAVIYDPASYFGDRETDIAMTELFGGFGENFYAQYYKKHPKAKGYEQRKIAYNLYHILNHLNLFGEGYLSQSIKMIKQLIEHK